METAKKARWQERDARRKAKARARRADAELNGRPVTVGAVYRYSRDKEAWKRMETATALVGDEMWTARVAAAATPQEVMAIIRERREAMLK